MNFYTLGDIQKNSFPLFLWKVNIKCTIYPNYNGPIKGINHFWSQMIHLSAIVIFSSKLLNFT